MNEQCKKCYYSDGKLPICNFHSDEKGGYIRIDNATEKCNYYIKREEGQNDYKFRNSN